MHPHEVALDRLSTCCVCCFHHVAVKLVPEAGVAPAWPLGRCLLRAVCLLFHHPGRNAFPPGLRTRALRLIRSSIRVRLLSPPPASAGALTSARTRSVRADWTGKWSHRRDVRPGLLDTNETRRYLRFGGMVEAGGLAPPKPGRRRIYSALQLLLCHVSMELGARAGFAPATFAL